MNTEKILLPHRCGTIVHVYFVNPTFTPLDVLPMNMLSTCSVETLNAASVIFVKTSYIFGRKMWNLWNSMTIHNHPKTFTYPHHSWDPNDGFQIRLQIHLQLQKCLATQRSLSRWLAIHNGLKFSQDFFWDKHLLMSLSLWHVYSSEN